MKKGEPMDKYTIKDLPKEFARQRLNSGSVGNLPTESTALVIEWVRKFDFGEAEIRILLDEMFAIVLMLGQASGRIMGREQERVENPAIQSVGAAVAIARKKDREATRAVLDEVFQREAARGNPFHAFNEALKTVV